MTSFAWPRWEGCGHTQTPRGQTRWLPARAGARDHGGLPGLRGPGSPKGGRGAALAVPPSQPCPQLGGITCPLWAQQQKRDGAGGRRGRAAPPPDEGGTACRCEKALLTPVPGQLRTPSPTPTADSPTGGFPRALGVPPCPLPWLAARASPGAGPPSAAGCPSWHRALGDARQYVWGVRMKSRSSSLRIHFMSLLTALMAPALVPRGL